MQKHYFLFIFLAAFLGLSSQAQTNYGSEIVSYQKFGEGLMVTRAKMVPLSGVVSNFFFYNREDQPWNGNVWYEYDWEMRGRFPENGWSQIRVRSENGGQLKDAPVNISTSVNVGHTLYNYILIRKDNQYVYDIREDFDINTYDYDNPSAHGGNSVSLIVGGPRVYTTGGNVADIPSWKQLDYSLGVTAFDNGWAGSLPDGSYTGDMVIDYTRFYTFSGNNLNTTPQWQDEFNGNSLDYGKWQVANWTFSVTQFTGNNIRFEDGKLILKVNRDVNSGGNPSTQNLALNGTASQSTTRHNGQASRAIDGNTNGNWNSGSITHTASATNSWWEVDLANNSKIDQIVLFNRTNCCSSRLSNFSVSVLDEDGAIVWTKYYSETPSPSLTINLDATGKSVRVNVDGILSLAEVQVFGTSLSDEGVTNLALSGQASQSTTAYGGSASRAIDNNTSGNWGNGSVTHTSNQSNAWWEVELANNSNIEEIVLFNRTNCCSSRLSNFTVTVLDENDNTVWSQFYANTPSPSLAINLNASGRKVRVNLDGTLSLAEVQVFGTSDAAQTNEASNSNFFTAHKINGQKVGLSWLVDHTSNPIQYEIEYKNAEGSFESIGVVADKGESYNVYSFTDENPKIGNNTYRIKVLYEDYTIQYLAPRTISFDENDQSIVFPNPTEGNLFIDLSEYLGQKVVMTLTDLSGKVYLSKNLDSNHSERVNMNISNFRNGLYVLHIKPENRKAKAEKISLLRPY